MVRLDAQLLRQLTIVTQVVLGGAPLDESSFGDCGDPQTVLDLVASFRRDCPPEREATLNYDRVTAAFAIIDIDKDGTLSRLEIIRAIRSNADVRAVFRLDGELTATTYDAFYSRMDADMSDSVEIDEFHSFIESLHVGEAARRKAEGEALRLALAARVREAGDEALSLATAALS